MDNLAYIQSNNIPVDEVSLWFIDGMVVVSLSVYCRYTHTPSPGFSQAGSDVQ